jgi:hypothetical protein
MYFEVFPNDHQVVIDCNPTRHNSADVVPPSLEGELWIHPKFVDCCNSRLIALRCSSS